MMPQEHTESNWLTYRVERGTPQRELEGENGKAFRYRLPVAVESHWH